MKNQKYIVIGKYYHEQNSWIPNGDIRSYYSSHRSLKSASQSCEKAHYYFGGCDGGNYLSQVMEKACKSGTKKAQEIIESEQIDWYEYNDCIYVSVDFFDRIEFVPGDQALSYSYKGGETN